MEVKTIIIPYLFTLASQVVHAKGWSALDNFTPDNWFEYFDLPQMTKYAAGLMYMMRLNPKTRKVIESHLQQSLPCDFDPERTISLPIRASDKCNDEKCKYLTPLGHDDDWVTSFMMGPWRAGVPE